MYYKYADKLETEPTQPDFVADDLLQLLDVLDQLNASGPSGKDS